MFLAKEKYVFGSQITGKTISLNGEMIIEYLNRSKYDHLFIELWGAAPIISCLFHKAIKEIDYVAINDYDYECDYDYDGLGWKLKAETLEAILSNKCPPSQAVCCQGWVVDIVADMILFVSDQYEGFGLFSPPPYEDFEQNLEWILLEVEDLIPPDMLENKKMVSPSEGSTPYPYNVEAFNFLKSTYRNIDREERLILIPEHHIIF